MERMEVDQCAGAAGGALRRSNSAPMITGVSDGTTIFSSVSSTRFRRSSVSINPSQLIPSSPFSLSGSNPKRPEEKMETTLRGGQQRLSPTCLVPVLGSQWHDHATSVSSCALILKVFPVNPILPDAAEARGWYGHHVWFWCDWIIQILDQNRV
uniref:Family with sequence similarity 122B n=1 Tax=Nothobranchius korthausae TaxID=1143690 RepID=A0A1A8FIU3_9TELE